MNRIALGDISNNFINAMVKALRSLHTPSGPLLEHYQISESFLNTPGARVSIPRFMRLGRDAIEHSHTPHFGLIMGKHMNVANMGISGFAAMTSETVGDALKTLIHFETLGSQNSRGHSRFYLERGRAVCQFYSISPYNEYNYFVVDSMLSAWYHFAQWLSEETLDVERVEVEYTDCRYQREYEKLFRCPVYFGAARNALVFTDGDEKIASQFRNQATHTEAINICAREKQKLDAGKTTKDIVVDLISAHLTGTPPNIHDIAQQMGMAGWTLRRRLKEDGEQFQSILDETRHALARTYVTDTHHNFTEIAFLLGFSSPAAFQKAFKRWTAQSPGEFRKTMAM